MPATAVSDDPTILPSSKISPPPSPLTEADPDFTPPPAPFVDVQAPGGQTFRTNLSQSRCIIGRSAEAHVHLESADVSRQHAELFQDPFGAWWIRDLNSLNGIFINGSQVDEIELKPGDECEIGDFHLYFCRSAREALKEREAAFGPKIDRQVNLNLVEDQRDTDVTILDTGGAHQPKLDVSHVHTLTELGERLSRIKDATERLRLLCRTMVRKDFHGQTAMVLRVPLHLTDRESPLEVVMTQTAKGWRGSDYVSRTLIRSLRKTKAPVLASNVSSGGGEIEMSLAPQLARIAAVACPLSQTDQTMDVLYVLLPPHLGTAQWLAVIALAVKQYEQAESYWIERRKAHAHAAVEHTLANARKIQSRLAPRMGNVPGMDFALEYRPSKWLGGDYLDAIPMRDGRMLLIMADSRRPSLEAALLSLKINTIIRALLHADLDLTAMIAVLNAQLHRPVSRDSEAPPVHLAAIALHPETGLIESINADHPSAVIIQADGGARRVAAPQQQPALGAGAQFNAKPANDQLQPGELLAMVSDGVLKLADPKTHKSLGLQGAVRIVAQAHRLAGQQAKPVPLKRLSQHIMQTYDKHEVNQQQQDDRSLIIARLA